MQHAVLDESVFISVGGHLELAIAIGCKLALHSHKLTG